MTFFKKNDIIKRMFKKGETPFIKWCNFYMNKKHRFSVIISAYNVEEYIERAINSVLDQDFRDYEIIVVEDKSTDETLNKIKQYDGKIKIIENIENKGLGGVRNIGIEHATGEYIIHLDGDDTLYSTSTLKKIDKVIGSKKPDIAFFGFQELNGENDRIRIATKENSTQEARLICDAAFSVPSKCWRREFLVDNNIKFIEDVYYEDMIYSMKAVTLAKETTYGEFPIFNYYKNRSGSIMTTPSVRRCTDMYKMLAYLMEIYEQAPEHLKPYVLSFILNETQSLPLKLKGIMNAINNKENSPIFPKRQYKFKDIKDIEGEL